MLPFNKTSCWKMGDLQNLSKVGLNMCFTADLCHWKSNFEHFPLKFTGLATKLPKREILRQKGDLRHKICSCIKFLALIIGVLCMISLKLWSPTQECSKKSGKSSEKKKKKKKEESKWSVFKYFNFVGHYFVGHYFVGRHCNR